MKPQQILIERARTQEGLVARFQVPDLDLTRSTWWRAKQSASWEQLSSRVLRLVGSPESDSQRALAAVLDLSPGGMLHGPSALAWLGMGGYTLSELHVARERDLSSVRSELATLHQLRSVRPHDVVVVRGVTTETALRAIWNEIDRFASKKNADLVALGVKVAGRLLDEANRRGLVSWAALHAAVEREVQLIEANAVAGGIARCGRAGTVIMRAACEQRSPGGSPTESRNEARFEEILDEARLPRMQRQDVIGGEEPIGRTDFRDHILPLAAEVNSITYHTTPSDRERDQVRYQRYNDAGFTVAVIWEDDLWKHPRDVANTVMDARQHARTGNRVVVHTPTCPWPSQALAA